MLKECPKITDLLDVTYPETPIEVHDFYTLPNRILTPHIAGSIGDEVCRMAYYILDEYLHYINNENAVTK